MPSLDLDQNDAQYQIKGYKPGFLQINDQTFTNSVIITPSKLINYWPPETAAQISAVTLDTILTLEPDILLIGTGEHLVFLAAEVYGALINKGIGVEVMNTNAACRTFNALAAENRNVAAALVIK